METSQAEAMIENEQILLSDVSFSYEDKKILEHVSAKINMNQTYVLKGANGIGKSSLFHLVTGLTECQNGKITIGNANSLSFSEKNFPEKLFYLPQEDAQFDFSPNELYQMILDTKMDLVYEIAKSFGLKDDLFFDSKISELSGGERKKVFLSLAFALNPQILLLDEPTNSLDESGKYRLNQLLKERMGGALIITHENCFDEIADHIYVLENGGLKCEEIR